MKQAEVRKKTKQHNSQGITVSLVLPVYKQDHHIEALFAEYVAFSKKISLPVELLFVVNGPQQYAFTYISKHVKSNPNVKVFSLTQPGWGRAVLHGLQKAKGTYVCYTNTARTDLGHLARILPLAVLNKSAVVKATRIVRSSWVRKLGSVLYNLEARLLFGIPVWDVNATPKVIPRSVLKRISLTSKTDVIDVELLSKCMENDIPILEVPIRLDT